MLPDRKTITSLAAKAMISFLTGVTRSADPYGAASATDVEVARGLTRVTLGWFLLHQGWGKVVQDWTGGMGTFYRGDQFQNSSPDLLPTVIAAEKVLTRRHAGGDGADRRAHLVGTLPWEAFRHCVRGKTRRSQLRGCKPIAQRAPWRASFWQVMRNATVCYPDPIT
jgi:hypothetical protein